MDSWIVVRGQDRVVKVRAQKNGTISEDTLRRAFMLEQDVPIGLFRNNIALKCLRERDNFLFDLESEWLGAQFELNWEETRRSRQVKPIPMDFDKVGRIQKIFNEWEDRVFVVDGEGLQGSGILISHQHILTAAHLVFKLNEVYTVRGTNNRSFTAKCEFISKKIDFAMLKSTDLPEFETSTEDLVRGSKYVVLGYPDGITKSKPSVTKGTIEGTMEDLIHLVGSPGLKQGYSGAPVFNCSGYLAGILLEGTSSLNVDATIRECLEASAEQKYARILKIPVIISHYNQGRSDNES